MRKTLSFFLIILTIILSLSLVSCKGNEDLARIKGSIGSLEHIVDKEGDFIPAKFNLPNEDSLDLNIPREYISDFFVGETYSFAYDGETLNLISYEILDIEDNKDEDFDGTSNIKPVEDMDRIPLTPAKFDVESLTLVNSLDYDLNNKPIKINLYTSAGMDDDGQLILDDGQEWKLIVHREDGDFLLFNSYVQGKPLDLYVFTEDEEFKIAIVQSGTANLSLYEYSYNDDEVEFILHKKYGAENNVNMIYNN